MNKGIYVHIPFCVSKCKYCSFVSSNYDSSVVKKYFDTLFLEIYKREKFFDKVDTIYFGGGTPTSVKTDFIKETLIFLNQNYDLKGLKEVTIEMNPESTTEEKILIYKEMGFNRFSIGVQSFDDKLLKFLGRRANSDIIFKALSFFKESDNLSVDFLYGIKNFKLDLLPLKNFPIKHVSAYILSLEKGSALYSFDVESDDITEEYYKILHDLKSMGFKRYEVSNFAREGFHSIHNMAYWDLDSIYIGYGVSSASYDRLFRYKNTDDIFSYITDYKKGFFKELIDDEKRKTEYLMLGLRKTGGISYDDDLLSKVNTKYLENYINEGYLAVENKRLYVTDKGFLILNLILRDILS